MIFCESLKKEKMLKLAGHCAVQRQKDETLFKLCTHETASKQATCSSKESASIQVFCGTVTFEKKLPFSVTPQFQRSVGSHSMVSIYAFKHETSWLCLNTHSYINN